MRRPPEKKYLDFIGKNIELFPFKPGNPPETIYIGGGTPSILSEDAITSLVGLIRKHFGEGWREASIEVNPGDLKKSWVKIVKDLGFTRLSIGVQSFQRKNLEFLGRRHTEKEAEEAIKISKSLGFTVSVDLIFGIKDQTVDDLILDLKKAVDLEVDHISLYGLTIEEGTKFYEMGIKVSEEEYEKLYLSGRQFLEENGFECYEISNFSKPGKACIHNVNYWLLKDYIGLGPSSVSFIRNAMKRITVMKNLEEVVFEFEDLTQKDIKFEELMLLTRTSIGYPLNSLIEADEIVEEMERNKLIKIVNGRIILTPRGALLHNEIVLKLSHYLPIL